MDCPICHSSTCLYWQLYNQQSWHPSPANLEITFPKDYLQPLWRLKPELGNDRIFVLGLDPREACYVLCNGASLNEKSYRASFEGCDGKVQLDGRIAVRFTLNEN